MKSTKKAKNKKETLIELQEETSNRHEALTEEEDVLEEERKETSNNEMIQTHSKENNPSTKENYEVEEMPVQEVEK